TSGTRPRPAGRACAPTRCVLSPGPGSRVVRDLTVDLPGERDQITTRSLPGFVALRTEVGRAVRGT
ncbi:hypothetical protein ACWD4N_45560, partial [Streptomyces sp. NPDC002586]